VPQPFAIDTSTIYKFAMISTAIAIQL
jgi:hypothetical protein